MTHSAENDAGLEARYRVEKINDPTGKHDACRYFVLDPQHDRIARAALRAYARGARSAGHFALADDLDLWLHQLAEAEYTSMTPRCPVHHLPRTADTWMQACTCPSTAHGIEEAD